MRVAVFSDIHSNLEAFTEVLRSAGSVDRYLCLGDIVGYGANPNEVIQLIKQHKMLAIKGNHDEAVLTGIAEGFNATAASAVEWTSGNIRPESLGFLQKLPIQLDTQLGEVHVHMVHGSPEEPLEEYIYPDESPSRLESFLTLTKADLLLLGHTHIPMNIPLTKGRVLNPGSVGQPRDRDPRASYAILEIEGQSIECSHHRVAYDIEKAAGKIREAGLPSFDAERLYEGL
jgi:putative phosphoesterase